jgi:hypothetical protein
MDVIDGQKLRFRVNAKQISDAETPKLTILLTIRADVAHRQRRTPIAGVARWAIPHDEIRSQDGGAGSMAIRIFCPCS